MTERERQREALAQTAARLFLGRMPPAWVRRHEEDVRQVARIAAWRAEERYVASRGAYSTFLVTAVERRLLNYLRDANRHDQPCLPLDGLTEDGEPLESAIPGDLGQYDERLIVQSQLVTARRAWKHLPTRERQAVRALYGHGLNQSEAAARMGVTPQYVSRMARRGLASLRRKVSGGYSGKAVTRCISEGCGRPAMALGLCNACYQWGRTIRKETGHDAMPEYRREKSHQDRLSACLQETLRLIREHGDTTLERLQVQLGTKYRTMHNRLQSLKSRGYVECIPVRNGEANGPYIWRAVQC